jgi:hypothetical protein
MTNIQISFLKYTTCAKQILNPFNYLASLTRRLQKSAIEIFSKNIQFIFTPRGSLFPYYNTSWEYPCLARVQLFLSLCLCLPFSHLSSLFFSLNLDKTFFLATL